MTLPLVDCACDWDAGTWFPCERHKVSSNHATHTEVIPWCPRCQQEYQRQMDAQRSVPPFSGTRSGT